jgi:hypothetical protein
VVGVAFAALGAFAVGALRPLGRFSELLLLPFAPWLFVGLGPLSLANWVSARNSDQLNTSVGLAPRTWLVIPALFAFTLLFRGLAAQWPGRLDRPLVLALPMVPIVAGATLLVRAQETVWTLLVAIRGEEATGPLLALRRAAQYAGFPDISFDTAYPVVLILVFAAALVAAQLFYLDRLVVRVGREPSGGRGEGDQRLVGAGEARGGVGVG